MAAGIHELRERVRCDIVAAALGPKMCRLAGAEADGVLLNWLTPRFARTAISWIREGADSAGRRGPRIMAYVRTALGEDARQRLEVEAGRYGQIPAYAAHFRRMGVSGMETAVTGRTGEEIDRGLAAWNGIVDEVVVRAITAGDSVEELRELLAAV